MPETPVNLGKLDVCVFWRLLSLAAKHRAFCSFGGSEAKEKGGAEGPVGLGGGSPNEVGDEQTAEGPSEGLC
jgi:hypothetical protein